MSGTWVDSIDKAEQRCCGYLLDNLGSGYELGTTAFCPEMPDLYDYAQATQGAWEFHIDGGGTPIDFECNMNDPGRNSAFDEKEMAATFEGVFNTHAEARRIQGALMDALPMPELEVANVERFRIQTQPMIERGVIARRQDRAKGGDQRVWKVTCQFLVLFNKSE